MYGRNKTHEEIQHKEMLGPLIGDKFGRVAGRESSSPGLLGSLRTSPEVPQTSPEVPQTSPELNSNPGSPEVSQTSPEVPETSPEVPGLPRRSAPFSGKPDTLS